MKRTIKLLALAAALAVFAVPVLAQDQCTDENKDLWYTQTFLKNFKGDAAQQKLAYDAAKKYIAACPADQYSDYMQKKFVEPYEKLHANLDTATQFQDAVTKKNYADQFKYGEQLVGTNPDNASVIYILMASAGLGDATYLSRSGQAAKKAIELIEGGKPFEPAYKSKDQALAAMNYIVAKSVLQSAPADAIPYYLKAARYESDLKKSPQLYIELADAYDKGPGKDLSAKYKGATPNGTETPESKVILENLNQVTDRQIDALARAAALTTDANNKKAIVDDLTALYKYRNKTATDANVTELVAKVLSTPIPDVPTPVTSLPTNPTPSSTPATNGTTNGNGSSNGVPANGGTNNGTKPTGNSMTSNTTTSGKGATGTGTGTPGGAAKPTATPTPQRKPLKFRRD